MLSNTLLTIEKTANSCGFDQNSNLNLLLDFFSRRKENDIIYPGIIRKMLSTSIETAYLFLSKLYHEEILNLCFESYCSFCGKTNSEIYDSYNDIPEIEVCRHCDSDFNTKGHTIVIYKVNKNV